MGILRRRKERKRSFAQSQANLRVSEELLRKKLPGTLAKMAPDQARIKVYRIVSGLAVERSLSKMGIFDREKVDRVRELLQSVAERAIRRKIFGAGSGRIFERDIFFKQLPREIGLRKSIRLMASYASNVNKVVESLDLSPELIRKIFQE